MTTRAEITAAALSMVGTRFHAQGRAPGIGLDCVGLVVCVARACGTHVIDRAAYPMRPNGELQGELESRLERVAGEPQEGDILLMSFDREPHHVAIFISENRIVHAHAKARKTVVQSYTDYWRGITVAAYRFKGVE
jgi:cell wall-associated NlpC family hydrolase